MYLLKSSSSSTKHFNKQVYLLFNVVHFSYLIKNNISYLAVALSQHYTIVEHKYNKTITSYHIKTLQLVSFQAKTSKININWHLTVCES